MKNFPPRIVVSKAWGHEEILANDDFCFKRLIVKGGWQVSYHHHKIKDELFYLESGEINIEFNNSKITLHPGDWLRVRPGDWHSFAGVADRSVLLEASTHDDPGDSYRNPERLSGRWR